MGLPTKYAIVDIAWGEHKKHLHCPDCESLVFYPTEAAAMEALRDEIAGGSRMMALLKIERVFKLRAVELEQVE